MTWDIIESKWAEMALRVQGQIPQDIDAVSKPVARPKIDGIPAASVLPRGPVPARSPRDPSRR